MSHLIPTLWSLLLTFNHPVKAVSPALAAPAPEPPAAETLATGFALGRASFPLSFGSHDVPYSVMGVFVLPGEEVTIEAGVGNYALEASRGIASTLASNGWRWQAPTATGPAALNVRRLADGAAVTLNVFVMVPHGDLRRGVLNGYRIGSYPAPRNPSREAVPAGFVEVTPETEDILVAPHFRLGQFTSKAPGDYPKYLVLQTPLLKRLEHLLETLNQTGVRANTFKVMSAYRSPLYNRQIGNSTRFTRHQYGDAADILVDESPADGRMDDLNGNRRIDQGDAQVLYRLAEQTEGDPAAGSAVGGLSAYEANAAHGPFIHVDTRGYSVRW